MEKNIEIKKIETIKVVGDQKDSNEPTLSIDKQLFVDHIMFGNVSRGKFIRFFVYFHIALTFLISFIYGLCLLGVIKDGSGLGFHNNHIFGSSIAMFVILFLSFLILNFFIFRYKLFFKKSEWIRLLWLFQVFFLAIFIVGMYDHTSSFVNDHRYGGAWPLILTLFIFIEIFQLHEFLCIVFPAYNKLRRKLKSKKDVEQK